MSVTAKIEAHAKGTAPDVKPEEKTPVMVHCRDCGHEWAAFYIPLVMDDKGMRLMKNAAKACPMCAGKKIYMGTKRPPEAREGED